MPESHRTIVKCDEIHESVDDSIKGVKKQGRWLVGLLVGLMGVVVLSAAVGWSASANTNSLKIEVQSNYRSIEKSLETIQTDVREVRATQRELLRDRGGGE